MAIIQYYITYLIVSIHYSNVIAENKYCIEKFAKHICPREYDIYKETSLQLVSVVR